MRSPAGGSCAPAICPNMSRRFRGVGAGFRGINGPERNSCYVSTADASPGFRPGALPAGQWTVLLAVGAAPQTTQITAFVELEVGPARPWTAPTLPPRSTTWPAGTAATSTPTRLRPATPWPPARRSRRRQRARAARRWPVARPDRDHDGSGDNRHAGAGSCRLRPRRGAPATRRPRPHAIGARGVDEPDPSRCHRWRDREPYHALPPDGLG